MIRRRGQEPEENSSSSDEDDVFSALSSKNKKQNDAKRSKLSITPSSIGSSRRNDQKQDLAPTNATESSLKLPVTLTSSMKRHHKTSDTRKAKMDALLLELAAEQKKLPAGDSSRYNKFVPEKKGSFIDPGEEHLTTNIFVGNLAPSITEEDLTDLFLQYGDLYSIKIMWPRTAAERSRKRNTGFVCFMNREDAEEAMEACNEADPFNVGRLMMMRWGKNVKRSVRQGTGGGFEVAPMKKVEQAVARPGIEYQETIPMEEESLSNVPVRFNGLPHIIQFNTDSEGKDISRAIEYDSTIHGAHAIRVEMLTNPKRFHFVSTVAKYVAKDGSDLEKKLIEKEAGNQLFNFLTLNHASTEQRKEHIFYRWRVYSFCQGGGYLRWRTEPFIMFLPHGKFWVPPPLNEDIRQKVEASNEVKPREKEKKKDDRRHLPREIEYMTGRQFERARGSRRKRNRRGLSEGRATMIEEEEEMFDFLVKKKLTISREAICQAMAFCFERSGSAREISELLKASLVDDAPFISVDTKIARLYLLSDILFNSQQPGVKNAFMYRDSIEKMAPEVFTSLGRNDSKDGSIGRMTMHKLRTAIKTVLGAWAEWSVYNPSFLDELEARFEGKEIKIVEEETKADVPEEKEEVPPEPVEIIIKTPMGRFIEFSADEMVDSFDRENGMAQSNTSDAIESERKSRQGKNNEKDDDVDDNPVEEDIDGQAAQHGRNVNGIPADQQDLSAEVDGSPIENIDGSSVSEEDIDGEPAEENNVDKIPVGEEDLRDTTAGPTDIDGEELDEMSEEDIDGSSLASGDIDIDGEDLDIDDLDGEDLDGEEM